MRIVLFEPSDYDDTATQELPELDMTIDPRPCLWFYSYKFKVSVNGTTLTITRIDSPEDRKENDQTGWRHELNFRAYSRNEFRYLFESTEYIYHGLENESAPNDATEVIVKDGVETIGFFAFFCCSSLSKITLPNTVTRIEWNAFSGCGSLRSIQLPQNLQYIGTSAFCKCSSLEAIYIPPSVTEIYHLAFHGCGSLRIINIPDGVQFSTRGIGQMCDIMTDEIKYAQFEQQRNLLTNRYNPLHNLCWDPNITAHNIQQHIQSQASNEERATTKDKPQFTALHLLAANPSVTGDMISTYLDLAPDVAIMRDNIGKTPLHMLCSIHSFSEHSGSAMRAYIVHCDKGKTAAFMEDNDGRTPFHCLCRTTSYANMPFLKDKSFGGLMEWWFDSILGINLFAGTF